MQDLRPLSDIPVPDPAPDEPYTLALLDRDFRFDGLKALLGAADVPKAGDRLAGLAAGDEVAREAARAILSELTLQHLYDRPLPDTDGRVDEVMRANYAIDADAFDADRRRHARRAQGPPAARRAPTRSRASAAASPARWRRRSPS